MYGVPNDLDLSPFVNKEIGVVNVGQFTFTLIFEKGNLSIACEGQVIVFEGEKPTTVLNGEWVDLNPLVRIQNLAVISTKIESGKSFSFTLLNGIKILFVDNSSDYESFQVHIGKKLIVI